MSCRMAMQQIEKMRRILVCCVIETGKEYTWAQLKADPEVDGPSLSVSPFPFSTPTNNAPYFFKSFRLVLHYTFLSLYSSCCQRLNKERHDSSDRFAQRA